MSKTLDYDALAAKLAEVEAERDAFASNIPDAAQNLIRNAHTGRLKALHRAVVAEAELARADLATPLDDPLVKAVVEAAREVKADCIARADKHGVVPIGRGAWDQLTAALSALEKNK